MLLSDWKWNGKQFGDRLAQARINAGLSQEQLARVFGKKNAYISNWENGHASGEALQLIAAIANITGVSTDWLVGFVDEPTGIVGETLPSHVADVLRQYQGLSDLGQQELQEQLEHIVSIDTQRRDDDARREVFAVLADAILVGDESQMLRDAILASRNGDLGAAHSLARRIRLRLGL